MSEPIDRRDVAKFGALVLAALTSGTAVTLLSKRPPVEDVRVRVALPFEDRMMEAVIEQGRAYMDDWPHARDAASLERNLRARIDKLAADAPRSDAESLRLLIEEDFVLDRTVRLRGWIVSVTEAEVYALATSLAAAEPESDL
jgi:hypothetical protein